MQKKDYFRFYISIILAAIGLFSIFSPTHAMFAVAIILGILFTVWGVVLIIRHFNSRSTPPKLFEDEKKKAGMPPAIHIILSFLLMIAGILLLVFSGPASSVFFPVLIGLWALVSGVFATINAIGFYKNHKETLLSVISLIVSFATAIALFVFSSSNLGFTSPAGGVFLLVFGFITAIEIAASSRKKNAASSKKVA